MIPAVNDLLTFFLFVLVKRTGRRSGNCWSTPLCPRDFISSVRNADADIKNYGNFRLCNVESRSVERHQMYCARLWLITTSAGFPATCRLQSHETAELFVEAIFNKRNHELRKGRHLNCMFILQSLNWNEWFNLVSLNLSTKATEEITCNDEVWKSVV